MNKFTIIMLGFLLIGMNQISAELLVSPSPLIIELEAESTIEFDLTLTNNFNFRISNFEFTNLEGFTFPEIILEPNETKTIIISVSREDHVVKTISSEISFRYLVDLPEGQQDHSVIITSEGFTPQTVIIRQEDTVTWNNLDSIKRTATSTLFDLKIEPNASQSFQFNDIEDVSYFDETLFFGGTIRVINKTKEELVNNPSFNKILTVDLRVTLDPTNIGVTNNQNNYTLKATATTEGQLQIENIGNITAQQVQLSADPNWIIFKENNFDLEVGENNFVTYSIEPLIFQTEETNQTYNVDIKIKAANSEEVIETISIFIPFENVFEDGSSDIGFISQYEKLCRLNPQAVICTGKVTGGDGSTTFQDQIISTNLTSRELLTALRRIGELTLSNQRTNNELKQLNSIVQTQFPEFARTQNTSLQLQINNEKKQLSRSRVFWILLTFVIICSCIIFITLSVRKYYSKANLQDGGFNYRF